jgi:hypothetical protein
MKKAEVKSLPLFYANKKARSKRAFQFLNECSL